jgi:hypothetical protein
MNRLSEIFYKYRNRIFFIIYYFLFSLTFCYLYYQKLVVKADFYSYDSSSGIYAVLNFEAIKVLQYRLLVPFVFKILSLVFPFGDKAVYFLLTVIQTFIIIFVFYHLLNEYFVDRKFNAVIAPVIIYPMVWNYIILNGQLFYVDFSILIFILLGYLFIVRDETRLLLLTFLAGCFNHDSVGFLIVMYLLYNYNKIFTRKVLLTAALMSAIFIAIKYTLSIVFIDNYGVSFRLNHIRNYEHIFEIPLHRNIRNILLIYGGLHILVIIVIRNKVWQRISFSKLAINLTIIPYILVIYFIHSIEEVRNYIASIPFVLIPFLIFLSTIKRSFLILHEKENTLC